MKKKLAAVLLAAVTAMAMVACGSDGEATTTENPDATSGAEASDDGKLIVGTEAGFAPYEYLSGDQVVGVDMDIAQEIADELDKELVIQNMDFDGALIAVQQGKVDMVAAGVSVDEERAKVMDFSGNYVDSTEVIVVNAQTKAVTTSDAAGLEGKKVGVQQGNIADLWVSNTDNAQPGEIVRYTKFAQAADDLKNDKIDCIVMDEIPAQEMVASSDGALEIVEGEALFVDQYAIAVQKGNTELLEKINAVIIRLKEEGKIDEFIAAHSDSANAESAEDVSSTESADTNEEAE